MVSLARPLTLPLPPVQSLGHGPDRTRISHSVDAGGRGQGRGKRALRHCCAMAQARRAAGSGLKGEGEGREQSWRFMEKPGLSRLSRQNRCGLLGRDQVTRGKEQADGWREGWRKVPTSGSCTLHSHWEGKSIGTEEGTPEEGTPEDGTPRDGRKGL